MAGHGRDRQSAGRVRRRRARVAAQTAAAAGPMARFLVAVDAVRSAASPRQVDPDHTARVLDDTAEHLRAVADGLLERGARRRRAS